ncbi:penicillin-binding protein 2 [PVC group bacterium]|nr:penicillin-binding protein 2 [PVC group bacterium]
MPSGERAENELMRIRLIALFMTAAFLLLGTVLWRVQVMRASEFRINLDQQSMRRVRLPGMRGKILDRNGLTIAENRPGFCIAVFVEELRQPGRWSKTIDKVESVINELSVILNREPDVTREDIAKHINRRLPLPLLAWRDLDNKALARWAENSVVCPGVDIYVEPIRVYPFTNMAPHLIGYVGRADLLTEEEDPYHYYLPEMIGKDGIERAMDTRLRGEAGGRLIRVDASGFKYKEKGGKTPRAGNDISLAIDVRIQQMAEEVLGNKCGAAVVMNPQNGDILALASSPLYDRNALKSHKAWQSILNDPQLPLINRALAGEYPPGSTFKPVIALTALQNGTISSQSKYNCLSYYQIGNRKINCWSKRGHGSIAVRKALEQSCNPFFCDLGYSCGYEAIWHMADAFGFGRRTGIELFGERKGLLPDDEWKQRTRSDGWRGGDTCNVSIGQGFLLVTPLQMAVHASTLANSGRVYRPRLVLDSTPKSELVNQLSLSVSDLRIVRGGMYDVVHAEHGTGKRVKIPGVKMAAKTGTAQYGRGKKHGWMILFAPFTSPRYAVSMIIEDAVSGGISVAPRMKALMQGILEMDGTIESGVPSNMQRTEI